MLRHNPEVKTDVEKLTRYDDHSIDARIEFIQQLLQDKDIEWSSTGDPENVHPATDGDFMSAVEKRADDMRERSSMKEEVIKEMDMLQLEKQNRMKIRHKNWLNKQKAAEKKAAREKREKAKKDEETAKMNQDLEERANKAMDEIKAEKDKLVGSLH